MTPSTDTNSNATTRLMSILLYDAESQVRHALGRLHHAGALQVDAPGADVFEQPLALAEQHGDEVDLDLVQEPGPDRLLRHVCARHADLLVPAAALACSMAASTP